MTRSYKLIPELVFGYPIFFKLVGSRLAEPSQTSRICVVLYNIYRLLLFICNSTYIFGQLYDMYVVSSDVKATAEDGAIAIESICCIAKWLAFYISYPAYKKLHNFMNSETMELKNQAHIAIQNKRYSQIRKLIRWFTTIAFIAVVCLFIAPTFEESKKLPTLMQLRFMDLNTSPTYEITYVIYSFIMMALGGNNWIFDMLAVAYMAQILVYLDCFLYTLKRVVDPVPQNQILDNNYLVQKTKEGQLRYKRYHSIQSHIIKENFKFAVEIHINILKFVKHFEETFQKQIFVQYIGSSVVICFTGIQIVTAPERELSIRIFSFVFYLTAILFEIFILCWFGNEIMSKSERLGNQLFHAEWMNCDKSIQSNVKIFLAKTQTPIILKAGKLFILNLKSFATVLNNAYSYFALLHHVYKVKNKS